MFSEKIEIALIKRKMSKGELADALNMTSQNIYTKLKKDNFTEADMVRYAEALGCTVNITLTLNGTNDTF